MFSLEEIHLIIGLLAVMLSVGIVVTWKHIGKIKRKNKILKRESEKVLRRLGKKR